MLQGGTPISVSCHQFALHCQDAGYVFSPLAVSLFSMITSSMAAMNLPGTLRALFAVKSNVISNCTVMKGSSDVTGSAEYRMH